MKLSKESDDIRILIVDDNPNFRTMTKMMLRQSGYRSVDTTDNPNSAMRKMQNGLYDLVFLDWWMPQMCGIDVLKTVRSFNRQLPIVMITSENASERVLEAIQAGATDYIVKPYSRKSLLEKLNAVLAKSEYVRHPPTPGST